MWGWNNPLLIGQSVWSIARGREEKGLASCVHSLRPELTLTMGPGANSTYALASTKSRELETSKLATTRILISRLASFVFSPPAIPYYKIAPLLSSRDISVPTIPREKSSDISPTPPTVDLHKKIDGRKEGIGRMVLGFLASIYSWVFPYFFSYYDYL